MSDPVELTEYLQRVIPVARSMGIRVVATGAEEVRLEAPFAPNVNDHDSAFAGSVSSLAILAGWTWVHEFLQRESIRAGTVLRASSLQFRTAARGDLVAIAHAPDPRDVDRMLRGIRKFGRGRVSVRVEVRSGDDLVAEHEGDYAAGTEDPVERP
ncbi:MAG: YiiD C-terminal domain-containing protein [Gemmatimonadetes bacterium]|nr:YiiD C-terminal domain-containing protein [Gemmatimonadota bacterium]